MPAASLAVAKHVPGPAGTGAGEDACSPRERNSRQGEAGGSRLRMRVPGYCDPTAAAPAHRAMQ